MCIPHLPKTSVSPLLITVSQEKIAKSIVERLRKAGFDAYYAGGWVRDHLLGLPCDDIDIATSALPDDVMGLFSKTVPVGVEFGSVVVVEEGHSFEVTTFRSEGPYKDGRRPSSITPSNAQEDAMRRSITINGMFFDPIKEEVIDFVDGEADLRDGIVRAIGDPMKRFEEDKLRMIRAVRFATRFDFVIEEETAKAILSCASKLFPAVSVERIWQEFEKSTRREVFFVELHRLGLLQQIFPTVEEVNVEPFSRFPEGTPTIAYVMALFAKSDLSFREEICAKLKVSKAQTEFVQRLYKLENLGDDPVECVHFYAHKDADLCIEIVAASRGDDFKSLHQERQDRYARHIERIRKKKPLINANTLRAHGIAPGKQMGELLREAERIAIVKDLNDPEPVLKHLNLPA